jgi:hypothetical protein
MPYYYHCHEYTFITIIIIAIIISVNFISTIISISITNVISCLHVDKMRLQTSCSPSAATDFTPFRTRQVQALSSNQDVT